mgnify:CR=1 FL=1
MAKKKFYAVRKGRKTGVFATWALCQEQIKGFSGAEYKSFTTKEEAEAFCLGEQAGGIDENGQKAAVAEAVKADGDTAIAYVDGSYDKFSVRLLEAFPGLSMKDVYFCCLVKINVSIKDLSDIYCISRTSISRKKQRMKRDKLGLTENNETLDDFLRRF